MSSAAVVRVANSAPSASRDYERERADLLERANAARAAMGAIDTDAAVSRALLQTQAAADATMQKGSAAAAGARAKIAEQQERFKAGMVADGVSLEHEQVEASSDASGAPPPNKYATQMSRRKKLQEAEKIKGS